MKTIALGAALLASTVALPALAADSNGDLTIFGYSVNASLRARVAPRFEGSKHYSVGPAGSISLSRPGAGRTFSAPDDSASLTLAGNDVAQFGVDGRIVWSRDNDRELRGFDKVDIAVEPGIFANYWITPDLRTRVEVRRGFGGHEGWVGNLGADWVTTDGAWMVAIGPRANWGDAKYAQTYFGVTAMDAARSPYRLPVYTPGGGFTSAGVTASADYQWKPRWRITADASWKRLLGDAADSPIVDRLGSKDQFSASVGVRYVVGR